MYRTYLLVAFIIALVCELAFVLYVRAQRTRQSSRNAAPSAEAGTLSWPVGYSADFRLQDTSDPSRSCAGRMYVNALAEPRGMRRESCWGERKRILIWKQGSPAIVLDPDARTFWKPKQEARLNAVVNSNGNLIGRETLNGREVDHYESPVSQKDGTIAHVRVWQDVRLHSTLRIERPGETYQLSNIQEGAQPESLFDVPEGYREVEPEDPPDQ